MYSQHNNNFKKCKERKRRLILATGSLFLVRMSLVYKE
jgi:hypothetical protein